MTWTTKSKSLSSKSFVHFKQNIAFSLDEIIQLVFIRNGYELEAERSLLRTGHYAKLCLLFAPFLYDAGVQLLRDLHDNDNNV
jgi:hypothetical protein